VAFAHSFETLLDRMRNQDLKADATILRLLVRSSDILSDLIDAARNESDQIPTGHDKTLAELERYQGNAPEDEEFSFDAVTLDLPTIAGPPDENRFVLTFTPKAALFHNGHDPFLLFSALADMGQLTVALDTNSIPPFDALDDQDLQLRWTLSLQTPDSETVLHDAFEFVTGLCDLDIKVTERQAEPPKPVLSSELPKADIPAKEVKAPKATLRVDLDRVDRLINTVGELIINQAMISQRIDELDLPGTSPVLNEIEDYKLLARDIQEGVMAIRAQPVKALFQRMARIVRETADATGKPSRFETLGESTEVDKTVIERLADPLTHMIRNAVDHGLESTEHRISSGKPAEGTIRLTAAHQSGNVVIEVSDDGGGLNREKILKTALSKGLIEDGTDLTDPEIDNLLFLPGFSTASEVSNLSGRGVGMDVVRNAVTALGGRITIQSDPGKGTTFSIVLPLTLAVMDGFVIAVGDQTMVVPIASIIETITPLSQSIHAIGQNGSLLFLRGKYVPIVDVAAFFGLPPAERLSDQIFLLVPSTDASGLCALAVDAIHDQRQVVVKSLTTNIGALDGVSSATILGNGRIALILDTDAIAKSSLVSQDRTLDRPKHRETSVVSAT
jgi:two-component system chemotaxis sensor kinase CheA